MVIRFGGTWCFNIYKVSGPNSITLSLSAAYIGALCVVGYGFVNKHTNLYEYFKDGGLRRAQELLTILCTIVNIVEWGPLRGYMIIWAIGRIFTLLIKKIVTRALKIMRKYLQPRFGFANHLVLIVCVISLAYGENQKSDYLRPIHFIRWRVLNGSLYSSPTSETRSRFGCQLRWVRVGWSKNCPLFFLIGWGLTWSHKGPPRVIWGCRTQI